MKGPYTFTILRYIHDIVVGEFVNVGVVLYAPNHKHLEAKVTQRYGRISKLFPKFDHSHFLSTAKYVESLINQNGVKVFSELPLESHPQNALGNALLALPLDDSSLQFSKEGFGLTSDPKKTLEQLFNRYVDMYREESEPKSRSDADVWGIFQKQLKAIRAEGYLKEKVIEAPNLRHKFPHTWTNGVVNIQHPISFDLVEGNEIPQKAANWFGRFAMLLEGPEKFKLNLLMGKPADSSKLKQFVKAQNILYKLDCEKEFVTEEDAGNYAENLKDEIQRYMNEKAAVNNTDNYELPTNPRSK